MQTKHWNYDFECPILKEPIGKAFRDYRTTWPITFQAFYDWMIAKNFINEEDFKNEHKYMSEKMKAKMAFFDWKLHSAKQSLTSITPMDVKACGDIKILLEILLENYFIYTLKMNGEALKFIGFDSKESVINSYAHIIFDLRRMRQELRRMKFMGIYYEQKQKKCLMDDFKKSTSFLFILMFFFYLLIFLFLFINFILFLIIIFLKLFEKKIIIQYNYFFPL